MNRIAFLLATATTNLVSATAQLYPLRSGIFLNSETPRGYSLHPRVMLNKKGEREKMKRETCKGYVSVTEAAQEREFS